jgi:hypothetical protein
MQSRYLHALILQTLRYCCAALEFVEYVLNIAHAQSLSVCTQRCVRLYLLQVYIGAGSTHIALFQLLILSNNTLWRF